MGAPRGEDSVRLLSLQSLALCPVLGRTLGRAGRPVPVSRMGAWPFEGDPQAHRVRKEPARSSAWERQKEGGQVPNPPRPSLSPWQEESGVLSQPLPPHACMNARLQMGT